MKIAVSQRRVCLWGPRLVLLSCTVILPVGILLTLLTAAVHLGSSERAMAVHYSSVLSCGSNLGHKSMLG